MCGAQIRGTIRNWIRDGVLRAPVLNPSDVLVAERTMRNTRGRPAVSEPRTLRVADNYWVKVTACGTHAEALNSVMIALNCSRCREPAPSSEPL